MTRTATTILNPTDLRYLLLDSLKLYSDHAFFIGGSNPYQFDVNKQPLSIYLKNTHSSGEGRSNPDECRIQISRSPQFANISASDKPVFFLGYSDDNAVFTAWDPEPLRSRINQKQIVSVYSRFSSLQQAQQNGIAIYIDSNDQRIISFRPEYLGLYLENYQTMHHSNEAALLQLIHRSDSVDSTSEEGTEVAIDHEEFKLTKPRAGRDPIFKKMVYEAYGNRCAFSGMQLDIVEAAHIVPHSHESGTDEVQNGICLSPLHHKAYDSGLIYIDENYNIKLNEERVQYLEKIGKDGGLKKFLDLQYDQVTLPKLESYYPSKEYIRLANQIRGVTDEGIEA